MKDHSEGAVARRGLFELMHDEIFNGGMHLFFDSTRFEHAFALAFGALGFVACMVWLTKRERRKQTEET